MNIVRRVLTVALLLLTVVSARPAFAQTYPAQATFEIRDANGNLITSTTGVCPGDGLFVHSTGWLGNSDAQVTFHSDPVNIGTFRANSSGVLDFSFRVPNVENGMHTLKVSGTGADGKPRVVEASILCNCTQPANGQPTAVLGSTLDAFGKTGGSSSTGGGGAFAKTGADALKILFVAVDLVLVGFVLRMAVARSRQSRTT